MRPWRKGETSLCALSTFIRGGLSFYDLHSTINWTELYLCILQLHSELFNFSEVISKYWGMNHTREVFLKTFLVALWERPRKPRTSSIAIEYIGYLNFHFSVMCLF